MANGSKHAALRRRLRKSTGRRLLVFACLAASSLPGSSPADAQQQPVRSVPPVKVAPAKLAPGKDSASPAVAQAIAVGEMHRRGDVVPTSGGVLGQLFGSEASAAKGPKDDGRKAYALPPPDPASVNWSGVPYHAPKAGALASTDADQPIRDVSPGSTRTSTATAGTATTAARPGTTAPAARGSTIPQPPKASEPAAGVASARVAAALPVPPPALSNEASTPELSTNSSSRRSGRRAIDPLSPDEVLSGPAQNQAAAPSATANYPSIARRPLEPETAPVPPVARPQNAAPATTAAKAEPRPAAPAAVPQPPSLAAIDAKIAAQQQAAAAPPAEPEPKPEPQAAPAIASNEASQSEAQAEPMPLAAPSRTDVATPSPVSRTEPMIPAPNAPAYPPETIAAELSPLRPVQPENAASEPAPAENYIGSGIAGTPATIAAEPLVAAVPAAPAAGAAAPTLPAAPVTEAESGFVARGPAINSATPAAAAPAGKQLAAAEMPGIRVVTEGPSEILIRELTQYEVRVENRGAMDANGIVVQTSLPAWAEVKGHNVTAGTLKPATEDSGHLEWTLPNLPAGVVERLFVRIQPTGAGRFDVATNWTTLPQTVTAQVTVREPKLAIEIDGPDEIIFGQSQKYNVRVLNPGDAAASNVLFKLVSESGEPLEQKIGNIPAGKESSFEIEVTARELGQLQISGSAMADLDLAAAANKSVAVAAAKLEATISGPPLKFQHTDAIYHLQLTNSGRAASESISGEIRFPAGITYVGGLPEARVEGERLVWDIGSLLAGATKEFEFTCKMDQTGQHPLTVQCSGSAGGQASVEIETAVQAIADLKLMVIDPPAPAAVGSEVVYEVEINNRGSKDAEDVRVVTQFGNGIEPIRVEGHAGDVLTGQVLFHPIPRIAGGQQLKLKIVAKADRAGDHRFRAEVRSGESVLIAEEATIFVELRNERISRSSSEPASR